MNRTALLAAALVAVQPLASGAASLDLPAGAQLRADKTEPAGIYNMPIGPWREETGVPSQAETGMITRQAWRIGGTRLTSSQLLFNLRGQLTKQGYDIRYECEAKACGGYDFRYGTDVIGEPQMHVNLGDYLFLSASKPGTAPDDVSLLVSRTASAAYLQVVQVGTAETAPAVEPVASSMANPGSGMPAQIDTDIGQAMEKLGRFVLSDLVFTTGSADLGPGAYTSLTDLAGYLLADPDKRVALVGHTDAQGSLEGNISLSKRRAASVMDRLINDYGVPAGQLEAEGIGYLAPIASNQTAEGRNRNRRVEAILISTK